MKKPFIIRYRIFNPIPLIILIFLACAHITPYRLTNYFLSEDGLADIRAKRLAVLPFSADDEELGYQLADEFNLQLGKLGLFELVERQRVYDLFEEQDFYPERIAPETAVEIGKMLGAHGVILGNVSAYTRGKVGLNVRLVSVETGRQIWQASDEIHGSDRRVQILVDKADRYRLTRDPAFLNQILCRLIAETLKIK